MNIYELPVNFPRYKDVETGDVFMWFNMYPNKTTGKEFVQIDGHVFEVISKNTRVAEIQARVIKSYEANYSLKTKSSFQTGKTYKLSWSTLEAWKSTTRWLRTPAAKILFRERM